MSQGEAQVKLQTPSNPLAAKERRDRKRTRNEERGTKNKEPHATRPRMPHARSLRSLEPLSRRGKKVKGKDEG